MQYSYCFLSICCCTLVLASSYPPFCLPGSDSTSFFVFEMTEVSYVSDYSLRASSSFRTIPAHLYDIHL